jgi:hypothetical protein
MKHYHFPSTASLVLALVLAVIGTLGLTETTEAWRISHVGGYGLIVQNSPTFAYGSLDSAVNGQVGKGELVYLNGWQIGVYHVGPWRWVAEGAVQPIIDARGTPLVKHVTKQGQQYYLYGSPIQLPRYVTEAEKFLASPDVAAPVVYTGSSVPTDRSGDLIDTSVVSYSRREPVVATMRVTNRYNYIYLRSEPRDDAPQLDYYAYAGEILTAFEVVDGRWYRIAPGVWAPSVFDGETLMVAENVAAYAPQEYYSGGKWISIDLQRQRLTAWEGNEVVLRTPVKSGKYGYSTPTGVWKTFEKVANERMSGNDYDLLDVAWTQYFTSSGVAIHAAYWHNNYNGRPGSHGCVNTPVEAAKKLFMWAPLGTTVVTHNAYVYDAVDIAAASKWKQYERY